jgi:hypothetical protein
VTPTPRPDHSRTRRRIAISIDVRHVRAPAWVLACLVLGGLATSCSEDGDDEPLTGLTDDALGTCLDFRDTIEAEVAELPRVPCGEPHTHEIYALADSEAATYPGLEALEVEAQSKCLDSFEDYVGVSAMDSELFYSWLVPTLDSWDRDDDRQIVCILGEDNGIPLTGTMRNIGR